MSLRSHSSARTRPEPPAEELPVSEELHAPVGSGIELCYQTFGDPAGDPLLLVMGLGGPMTWWDDELCLSLARAGFHVVRYDNRDVGCSTRINARITRQMIVRAFAGLRVKVPYTMSDLADDAIGLMGHLGWESAHVAGVSMGGMISQTVAIRAPERVRSLTSLSSSTGRRTVGWQHPSLAPTLLARRGPGKDDYVRSSTRVWRMIASPDYPQPEEAILSRAADTFDRGISRAGVMRQMLSVITQRDRTARLRELRMPVSVIHGLEDKMVHVSGGRATAAAVPGAELLLVPGMGHDMPPELFDTITETIRRTADRATDA